ncbi:MAG: RsmB/NOP family class I SAM-dependent RNA methyltransferase [Rhodospirillaceae bacterium]|nr:RsmB/NOP family class I SAM-dependent RNA methyltransferase [Rhodospirillaceae bacterium]MBT5898293.1 RsmB/NOP family class I SAM-dependent RNA methyltransferase [Rhodospirillaceae bacterium]
MSDTGHRSRTAATKVLHRVLERGQMLDSALADEQEKGGRMAGLAPRDRAFARLMVVTVLRRLGQIDDAIDRCLDRPLNKSAKPARQALRLAAAQTMFLGTPDHAVADGAVRLMGPRLRHLNGLVNAVARRLIREKSAILAVQDKIALNCPGWLRDSWTKAYGDDVTMKMIEEMLSEPSLDLTLKGKVGDWARKLDAEMLHTGSLRRPAGGVIQALPGFEEGEWWVQDAAAALPIRLMGEVAGRAVLDLCAAPGGKTAQLAALGARVTAVDNVPKRLALLQANLVRLGLRAETVVADILTWRPSELFELIILDAPCSATGTIRRHPDIWRLRTADQVANAAELQDQMLAAAIDMLAPGGTLIFCTCSLQPEEGEGRIESLLAGDTPVRRAPIEARELFGLDELITGDGDMQTLPHYQGGMDGFFASRLIRAV